MRYLLHVFCFTLGAVVVTSQETATEDPQRVNLADRSAQELREIRQAVDAKAGAAAQTEALQYQAIYAALARCDDVLAQFRVAPEHERAGLLHRFDRARAEVLRLRRELQERGALPSGPSRAK